MGLRSFLSFVFAKIIVNKNNYWKYNAVKVQQKTFFSLLKRGKNTKFGEDHNFNNIKNYTDWKKNVPIRGYEEFEGYINLITSGEKNILWPGYPVYFCKTSGTTSGTKYIPISADSLPNHLLAARDTILSYIAETKNTSIVSGKMIFLQGSPRLTKTGKIPTGRLSGIVANHVPFYLQRNRLPSYSTNCIDDWEEKIDAIVEETYSKNMTLISGIPPWIQMYFEKLQKKTGKVISDLFPNFKLFIYGGVNYLPYKKNFEKLIGGAVDGVELYPASEGFIAYQDSQKEKGMLLCVNHGIFYEFISEESFLNGSMERVSLEKVVLNKNYIIILNTNAGLWGYNIGDTIKFVSISPYRIIVTGRIKHFTSAFGEHVIAEEVELSMQACLEKFNVEIKEFHVAPQVNPKEGLPFHEWFIEFITPPPSLEKFSVFLNKEMQKHNVYYNDLIVGKVLSSLKIHVVKKNGFNDYMKSIGRLGGQNKVPRLANDRKIADKLISL